MFNDDEYTTDDRAAGAWGAIILMLILGSCANKPYNKESPKPEKPAPKIEHIQPAILTTNQVPQNITFYKAQFKQR